MMSYERPATSVDICVCTFQRPFLAETLKSIANIEHEGLAVRVVVADNDHVPSAAPMVELIGSTFPFPLIYVHAPAANISVARNACLDAVDADFVAFVDDDETVGENWLHQLVGTALGKNCGVVLGPVRAVYDTSAPRWMQQGDFHSARPVFVGDEIVTGYTCNVLIGWTDTIGQQRFDLGLGRSGGEDTDFFDRLHNLGVRFSTAPEAMVYEPVPPSRARLSWLLRRRFRSGQTHGVCLRRAGVLPLPGMVVAVAKAAYCAAAIVVTLASPVGWRRNLLRGALHLGVLGGLAGARQAELYGNGAAKRRSPIVHVNATPST